jgi:transposase InsO family protein
VQNAKVILANVEAVDRLLSDKTRQARLENRPFCYTKALEQSCAELPEPISVATYYRQRKKCALYEWSPEKIAAASHRRTYNQFGFDRATEHFMDTMLLRYLGRNRSTNVSSVYHEFAREFLKRTGRLWLDPALCGKAVPEDLTAELLNLHIPMEAILSNSQKRQLLKPIKLPSKATFHRYARWFTHLPEEGKAFIEDRYGKDKWEAERMVFDTFVTRAAFPLQYVFCDHYLLDIFTLDDETRSSPERLWLTALIDAYTRCPLGFALLSEDPSIMSIQTALRHAIFPKVSHTELGIEGDWPCFGIPVQLFLDNAWAHHSYSLESLSSQISRGGTFDSILLDFRVPYKARQGALVERFFGNVSRQIKEKLPSAILSSKPRDVGEAKERACLLYSDLYRFFHELFIKYLHTPHSGLGGMTPAQKWQEGIRARLPLVPPLTPAVERLFLRLSPSTRQVNQKGISAFGMHYWSPELGWAAKIGKDGSPIQYDYRYDPRDISRLSIFRGGEWLCDVYAKECRLPDGSIGPLSLVERELARRIAVEWGDSGANWLCYVESIGKTARLRETEKRERAKQGQGRKHEETSAVAEREHSDKAKSTTHKADVHDVHVADAHSANDSKSSNELEGDDACASDFTSLLTGFAGGGQDR